MDIPDLKNRDDQLFTKYMVVSMLVSVLFMFGIFIFSSSWIFRSQESKTYFSGISLLFFLFSVTGYIFRGSMPLQWKKHVLVKAPFTWVTFIILLILVWFSSLASHRLIPTAIHAVFALILVIKGYLLFSRQFQEDENQDFSLRNRLGTYKLLSMVLCIYLPFGLIYTLRFDPTGDQPYYLLITHSLIYDRDFDIANNYENRDYRFFFPRELVPQGCEIYINNHIYSHHNVGYSMFLIPGYFLGGRLGAVWQNQVLTAFLSILFYNFLGFHVKDRKLVYYSWLIFSFSPPLLNYSCLLYPEILAAFIGFYVFYKLVNKQEHGSFTQMGLILILLFLLPIVKMRFAPISILLLGMYIVCNFKLKRLVIYMLLAMFFAAIIYIVDNFFMEGLIFLASYDPWNHLRQLMNLNLQVLIRGIVAFFIDQEFGLFATAPVYVLILLGLVKIRDIRSAWALLIALLYTGILVQIKKMGLHSLDTPPAPRFLVCVLPFYGVILALGLKKMKLSTRYFCVLLVLSTFILNLVRWCLVQGFSEFADGRNYVLNILDINESYHFQRFFPSIFRTHVDLHWGVTILIGITLLVVIHRILGKKIEFLASLGINLLQGKINMILISMLLTGLVLSSLYITDNLVPLHVIEAEEMIHKGGNHFPKKLDWWERDWNNWESQDLGWELKPGTKSKVYLNSKSFPGTISILANRTGKSSRAPILTIYLCGKQVDTILIIKKQFYKPKDFGSFFPKKAENMEFIQALDNWGKYQVTPHAKPCRPVLLELETDGDNTESIILNRIELWYDLRLSKH